MFLHISEFQLTIALNVTDLQTPVLTSLSLSGGVQLICNNMVTSTRAIVNTARSMVSTIMKFLDSGPGKAADGNLKARVMTSEPDNAEGLHNFAPLGPLHTHRIESIRFLFKMFFYVNTELSQGIYLPAEPVETLQCICQTSQNICLGFIHLYI